MVFVAPVCSFHVVLVVAAVVLSSFSCLLLALNFVCAAAVAALMILLTWLTVYRASCNLSNNVSRVLGASPGKERAPAQQTLQLPGCCTLIK